MSDDRFLRFKMKLTINGYTQIDGYFSVTSLTNSVNEVMVTMHAPVQDFRILYRALEGYHLHIDMVVGKTLIAYEIEAIADPDGQRRSPEPLSLPSPE